MKALAEAGEVIITIETMTYREHILRLKKENGQVSIEEKKDGICLTLKKTEIAPVTSPCKTI